MKRIVFIAITAFCCFHSHAQKGVNQLGLALELGLPTGAFDDAAEIGIGGSGKFLFGVTNDGQVTFTAGYSGFKVSGLPSGISAHYSIIPLLVGYRHNFTGFYLEPQAGVGIFGLKATSMGQSQKDSESAFTWAMGVGYVKSGFDIGIRYQSGKIADADNPISNIGIHVGYNIPLGGQR